MKYSMLVVATCLLLEPTWGQGLLRRPQGSRLQRPVAAQSADVGKEAIKVIPTAREGGATWKYKESDKPLANWADLSFDDKDWQEGVSGFGNSCGLRRTPWNGGANDLYLRKKFNVEYTVGQIESVSVSCAYDADIEILLNGSILLKKGGWNWKYVSVDVTTEFKRLVHESGQDNVLAVKAHDNGIPCYMDMGLDIVLVDSVSPTKKDEPSAAESSAATQSVARVTEIALIPFGGTDWKYKMQGEVEENWKRPDFNDASWANGKTPFGNDTWTTPCICLRKKFDCPYEDADIKYLQIREGIDDLLDVWLNGNHIFHWTYHGDSDQTTVVPRKLWEGLLRRKDNVLTVLARDWGGGRFVNVGLTAMVRQSVGKELVCPTEYVPADMKLIFPATKLADIQVCTAVLTGDAVNWGRPTAVLASNIKSFGDLRKTLQFQRLENACLKCVCVELEQKGRDVWGRVLYCRSVDHCDVSGVDFDALLCPTHRIIDNDSEVSNRSGAGYGLRELTAYFGALTGPYGIRMDVAPGCEKGAEYVLGRLRDDWLPRSLRYYGDPFVGKTPSRVYTVTVGRNDGSKFKYTGPTCFFGFGCGRIGLAKDSDKYELSLDWLAASVLTVCEEPNSSSFQQYVKRFLEGEAKGQDPVPQIKKDIQDGLVLEGADRRKKYPYMHTSMWAVFEELREKHPKFIQEYYQLKNSRFAEGRLPEKLSFDQVAGLLSEVTHENVTGLFKRYGIGADSSKGPSANGASRVSDKAAQGKIVVADKLQGCDFLLNKEFKKNAKFYLCLFSASWCGPCRREMPRIAKTYAETLKDDPDIELIHFSRDQNDEKALAWAKEHDVKFPVVKPNGGNPLDLHSRGIPHLFIVKADGTLVEEGHPMSLFTDEVLRKIKEGRPLSNVATEGGINWTYEIIDDGVVLGGKVKKRAVPEATSGAIKIPETIDGKPVRGIGDMAFAGCGELVSVKIPAGVKTVGKHAFAWCGRLSKIVVDEANSFYCDVDGVLYNKAKTELIYWPRDKKPEAGAISVEIMPSVTSIESWAFLQCNGFSSITIPSGVVRIGEYAFCACRELTSVVLRGERPSAPEKIFRDCEKLKSIHVPANAKSWAGMKEWQGIPLVFDAEAK